MTSPNLTQVILNSAAPARMITLDRLQRYALLLSNQGWCRHWSQFGFSSDPWIMAIQIRDETGSAIAIKDLVDEGFILWGDNIHLIGRCDYLGKAFHATRT